MLEHLKILCSYKITAQIQLRDSLKQLRMSDENVGGLFHYCYTPNLCSLFHLEIVELKINY